MEAYTRDKFCPHHLVFYVQAVPEKKVRFSPEVPLAPERVFRILFTQKLDALLGQ